MPNTGVLATVRALSGEDGHTEGTVKNERLLEKIVHKLPDKGIRHHVHHTQPAANGPAVAVKKMPEPGPEPWLLTTRAESVSKSAYRLDS